MRMAYCNSILSYAINLFCFQRSGIVNIIVSKITTLLETMAWTWAWVWSVIQRTFAFLNRWAEPKPEPKLKP